jgi:hypothetical protein
MEQKIRWINYQKNVMCDRLICHTGKKCNGNTARSLNEKDLHDNLDCFKVPQVVIESIRSKLTFKIFDEYANILKGMYSTRFNGRPEDNGTHDQMDTPPGGPISPLSPISKCVSLITLGAKRRRRRRGLVNIELITYIQLHI